ncbi:MAG: hypothetical protein R3F19_16110 [Verrucomicrobiales bacterium]
MVTDYQFDKVKIPKGMSFPLNRSRLDAALMESELSGVHCVYYWLRQSGNIVLRGDFCGEQRRGWAAAGQSSITVYAVPSEQRSQVESAIDKDLLPKLIRWLQEIERADNTWRAADRHFAASWKDGLVAVETY